MQNAKATSAKFGPSTAEVIPLAGGAIRQTVPPPIVRDRIDSQGLAAVLRSLIQLRLSA